MSDECGKTVIEKRWYCPYCEAFYAEYINGCPQCWMGEVGTSTSVVLVDAIRTADGWRLANKEEQP